MNKGGRTLGNLYGSMFRTSDDFGPDQSTIDDLEMDMGGKVYADGGVQTGGGIPSIPSPSFWGRVYSGSDLE